jgi:hypothetical protein
MLREAHASRFHWGEIGTPLQFERGEWRISRVYAVLDRPQAAIRYAQRCLDICTANQTSIPTRSKSRDTMSAEGAISSGEC